MFIPPNGQKVLVELHFQRNLITQEVILNYSKSWNLFWNTGMGQYRMLQYIKIMSCNFCISCMFVYFEILFRFFRCCRYPIKQECWVGPDTEHFHLFARGLLILAYFFYSITNKYIYIKNKLWVVQNKYISQWKLYDKQKVSTIFSKKLIIMDNWSDTQKVI